MPKKIGLGLDIGGTEIKVTWMDHTGIMYHKDKYPTQYKGRVQFERDLRTIVQKEMNSSSTAGFQIEVVSATFPGIVEKGVVTGGAENFPGIEPFPIQQWLEDLLRVPVITMNDATGMAWGEYYYGAARGVKDALFLTIGTGIGGSIMINEQIYNGTRNRGGELGHIVINKDGKQCSCGGRGCFQIYGSTSALIDHYRRIAREGHPDADGHWIVERYLKNEADAVNAMEWHFRNIAAGLGSLINIFCPPLIVLGGGIVNAGSFYLQKIEELMMEYTMDHISTEVNLVAAELGSYAGCAGGIGIWYFLDR